MLEQTLKLNKLEATILFDSLNKTVFDLENKFKANELDPFFTKEDAHNELENAKMLLKRLEELELLI